MSCLLVNNVSVESHCWFCSVSLLRWPSVLSLAAVSTQAINCDTNLCQLYLHVNVRLFDFLDVLQTKHFLHSFHDFLFFLFFKESSDYQNQQEISDSFQIHALHFKGVLYRKFQYIALKYKGMCKLWRVKHRKGMCFCANRPRRALPVRYTAPLLIPQRILSELGMMLRSRHLMIRSVSYVCMYAMPC